MSCPLILASRSPQRKRLLELLVADFQIVDSCIDEIRLKNETPEEMTRRLAIAKATAAYQKLGPQICVLGGDTAVAIDNRVLGKPQDYDHAVSMLTELSGNTHTVYSAVALHTEQGCQSLLRQTQVTFRDLQTHEIVSYCLTNDPYDKAGGYGIQRGARHFVKEYTGSYSGVIGLPLGATQKLLHSIRGTTA